MWIRWDVKDLRMLLPTEIEAMLSEQGSYQITLRLRESHALELQQRVLSSMGRVGLVTPMPATFPVEVSAYYLDVDGKLQPFKLPITAREGGVCYTGRDANGEENSRLVLTEPAIDELLTTISNIAEETVNAKAHDTLRKLKASTSLARDLQRGLKAPVSSKSSFQQIKATSMGGDGQAVEEVVGMVARNPVSITGGQAKYNAFVLVLRDEQSQTTGQQVEPIAVSQELSTPQESPDDGKAP
jgi:hypothetical protein